MSELDYNYNEYDYLFKFVLLGGAGVGKTSLILRYCDNEFQENYSATIGLDFKIRTIKIGNKTVKIQIWDTAGQERYNALTSVYYKGSHGCIAVYDITNRESFEVAKKHLNKAYTEYGFPKGCALLVGNKLDLETNRKVSRQEGLNLASAFEAGFVEASAKTSEYVDDIFFNLCQILVDKSIKGELQGIKSSSKSIVSAENIEIKRKNSFTPKREKSNTCCSS
jgi:small GTP-binding protein domain